MNSLFTFGCSFTENFIPYNNISNPVAQSRYIFEFLNGVVPDGWTDIVSKKLNYIQKNYSSGGDSNYGIFNQFCEHCNEFLENDIVIVQWTFVERFRWPNKENKWSSRLPGYFSNYDGISRDTYEEILVNRTHKLWSDEIYQYEKIIDRLCFLNKCKVFYLSFDTNLIYTLPTEIKSQKKYIFGDSINEEISEYLSKNGVKSISEETEGKINDGHLGKIGHEIFGNLIYNHIKKTYE
jgi:hypothetical protein